MNKHYTNQYFDRIKVDSLFSAEVVVPLVLDLVKPKSVVDVGCGVGAWLNVFLKNSVDDIFGIDGDWVNLEQLLIPKNKFLSTDLKKPLKLDRKFDLVVSLEVGEHISEEKSEVYVDSLVNLGDRILFSAAIPFQPGTDHINTQWPYYWKDIFERKGFVLIDAIRKKIWNNNKVAYYYSQNTFLYVKKSLLETEPTLNQAFKETNNSMLSLVHPELYTVYAEGYKSMRSKVDFLPVSFVNFLRKVRKIIKLS